MDNLTGHYNHGTQVGTAIPRMFADTDMEVVRRVIGQLPRDSNIVEIGPWLGGVTAELSQFGTVSVIDRFRWSQQNASRIPDLLEPGANFRYIFEDNIAKAGIQAEIHELDIRDYEWPGGEIDFCLVDAPRNAKDLISCLRPMLAHMSPGASLLVKHGANRQHYEIASVLHYLLAEGHVELRDVGQPHWCNLVAMTVNDSSRDLANSGWDVDSLDNLPTRWSVRDPWGGELFAAARIARSVALDDWDQAYRFLDNMPSNPRTIYDWDEQELVMLDPQYQNAALHRFSSTFAGHHDTLQASKESIANTKPLSISREAIWQKLNGREWRAEAFSSEAVDLALESGSVSLVSEMDSSFRDQHILAIGDDVDRFGLGAMCAGALSHLGLRTRETRRHSELSKKIGPTATIPIRNYRSFLNDDFDVCYLQKSLESTDETLEFTAAILALLPSECEVIEI